MIKIKNPVGIKYETESISGNEKEIHEWFDFETIITLKFFKWEKTFVINRERKLETKSTGGVP